MNAAASLIFSCLVVAFFSSLCSSRFCLFVAIFFPFTPSRGPCPLIFIYSAFFNGPWHCSYAVPLATGLSSCRVAAAVALSHSALVRSLVSLAFSPHASRFRFQTSEIVGFQCPCLGLCSLLQISPVPGPSIKSSVTAISCLRRCSTSVRLLLQSSLSLLHGCLDALIVCLTSSTVFGEPADHSMENAICLCVTDSALASWRLA